MNKNGPIIVIEDDIDDQEMLQAAFQNIETGNEIISFWIRKKRWISCTKQMLFLF